MLLRENSIMNRAVYQAVLLLFLLVWTPLSSKSAPPSLEISPQVTPIAVSGDYPESASAGSQIYLPLLFRLSGPGSLHQIPRINIPFFTDTISFPEAAVHWLGFVRGVDNYADIRVGYTQDELAIRLSIFDRQAWYDTTPSTSTLTQWDAVSLYLDTSALSSSSPGPDSYQFIGQLNWWEPRTDYQAAYRGGSSGWALEDIPFSTETTMRGENWNNNSKTDRGWTITYRIPFSSLNSPAPPPSGTIWRMAVSVHDRDDAAGQAISPKLWPQAIQPDLLATWGQIHFGLPSYSPPSYSNPNTFTIRNKLNGAVVSDADVGGGTVCGDGLDFWYQWGDTNYAGGTQVNIQNQSDVADWPCFSKFYVTFPLSSLPADKVVVSATLKLHQFGNSYPAEAKASLIQVLVVRKDWDENNLTWNNAPSPVENVSRSWVKPLLALPPWPGIPIEWDVSAATAQAYNRGLPLRLALYSADAAYHSGKYLSSSDVGDWNQAGRPTLTVILGDPTFP